MSKFYLYKVWFTSAFINPLILLLYCGVSWGNLINDIINITIEDIQNVSFRSVMVGILGFIGGLFLFFVLALLISLPVLMICKVVHYFLVQKTESEILVRIGIVLAVAIPSFVIGSCINGAILEGLGCAVLCSGSVIVASIYHSFRDKLNSYS